MESEEAALRGLAHEDHTVRLAALEQLRDDVHRNRGQLLFGDVRKLSKLLCRQLMDSHTSLRSECNQLLLDILPEGFGPDIDGAMTNLLPPLVENLGDGKVVIRKGSLKILVSYLKAHHDADRVITTVIKTGLCHDDWHVRCESAAALTVLLDRNSGGADFRKLVAGLVGRFRDVSDDVVTASFVALRHVERLLGQTVFCRHISDLPMPIQELFHKRVAKFEEAGVTFTSTTTIDSGEDRSSSPPKKRSNQDDNNNALNRDRISRTQVASGNQSGVAIVDSVPKQKVTRARIQNADSDGRSNERRISDYNLDGFGPRDGEELEWGLVPVRVFDVLGCEGHGANANWKIRSAAIEELMSIIKALPDNPPHLATSLGQLISFLTSLLGDTNFKISLHTLQILYVLIGKIRLAVKPYLKALISPLIDRFSDNKVLIKQAVMKVFIQLMHFITPKPVVSILLSHLGNSNWHVREEIINIVIIALLTFQKYEFDFPRLLHGLTPVVMDEKSRVRFVATEACSVLVNIVGEDRFLGLAASSGMDEETMDRLQEHFDSNQTLPTVTADGTLEHTTLLHLSGNTDLSNSGNFEQLAGGGFSRRSSSSISNDIVESQNGVSASPIIQRSAYSSSAGLNRRSSAHAKLPWARDEESNNSGNNACSEIGSNDSVPFKMMKNSAVGPSESEDIISSDAPPFSTPRRGRQLHCDDSDARSSRVMRSLSDPGNKQTQKTPRKFMRTTTEMSSRTVSEEDGVVTNVRHGSGRRPPSGAKVGRCASTVTPPCHFTDADGDVTPDPLANSWHGGVNKSNSSSRSPMISASTPRRGRLVSSAVGPVDSIRTSSGASSSTTSSRNSAGSRPYSGTFNEDDNGNGAESPFSTKAKMARPASSSRMRPLSSSLTSFANISESVVEQTVPTARITTTPDRSETRRPMSSSRRASSPCILNEHKDGKSGRVKSSNRHIVSSETSPPFQRNLSSLKRKAGEKKSHAGSRSNEGASSSISDINTDDTSATHEAIKRQDFRVVERDREKPHLSDQNFGSMTPKMSLSARRKLAQTSVGAAEESGTRSQPALVPWDEVTVGGGNSSTSIKEYPDTESGEAASNGSEDTSSRRPAPLSKATLSRMAKKSAKQRSESIPSVAIHASKGGDENSDNEIDETPVSRSAGSIARAAREKGRPWEGGQERLGSEEQTSRIAGLRRDQLQVVTKPEVAARTMIKNLSNGEWEDRVEATNTLRCLAAHHGDVIIPHLHTIILKVVTETSNLRSVVARNAVVALADMFYFLGRAMDQDLDISVMALLKKAAETNVFLQVEGDRAMAEMVASVSSNRAVLALLLGVSNKSVAVRRASARYLCEVLTTSAAQTARSKEMERVLPALAQLVSDASVDTRYYAKASLLALNNSSDDWSRLVSRYCSDSVAKKLHIQLETVSRKGLGTRPCGVNFSSPARSASHESSSSKRRYHRSDVTNVSESSIGRGSNSETSGNPPAHYNKNQSGSSPLPRSKSSTVTDELRDILERMDSSDWRIRSESIAALLQQLRQNPRLISSNLLKVLDAFEPRLADGNSKVNLQALHALNTMAAVLGNSLDNTEIIKIVPSVAQCSASNAPVIKSAAVEALDSLVRHADPTAMVQAFASVAKFSNARNKALLIDKLAAVVSTAYDAKPNAVVRYVLPVAIKLLPETKTDVKAAVQSLLRSLYNAMGDTLHNYVGNLEERDRKRLMDYIKV